MFKSERITFTGSTIPPSTLSETITSFASLTCISFDSMISFIALHLPPSILDDHLNGGERINDNVSTDQIFRVLLVCMTLLSASLCNREFKLSDAPRQNFRNNTFAIAAFVAFNLRSSSKYFISVSLLHQRKIATPPEACNVRSSSFPCRISIPCLQLF